MAKRKPALLVVAACLAGLSASVAFAAGDAKNGGRLAERWCASCHLVTSAQKQANSDAPPFATIARAPAFSPEKLAFFLLDPHPKMPSMNLTRQEAQDLAAYIASLK